MTRTQKNEKTLRKYGYLKETDAVRREEVQQLLDYINSGLSIEELKARLQQRKTAELAVTE